MPAVREDAKESGGLLKTSPQPFEGVTGSVLAFLLMPFGLADQWRVRTLGAYVGFPIAACADQPRS